MTRVVVSDGAPTPTVWQFDGSSFVEVDPSVEGIIARLQRPLAGEKGIEIDDVVTLELPMHLTGVPKPTIRFQAVAEQMGPGASRTWSQAVLASLLARGLTPC